LFTSYYWLGLASLPKVVLQAKKVVAAVLISTGRVGCPNVIIKLRHMWSGENKTWIHYGGAIIAADLFSALQLDAYTKQMNFMRSYLPCLEVVDLQRYKLYTTLKHIKAVIRERKDVPFVFVYNRN
jgi:hypothetical protein